jgi:FtsP/CotA-like multicopper oxidase with cupredoxin domain
VCRHYAAGDGYINMADGKPLYVFGFSDVTGIAPASVMNSSVLAATIPGPPLEVSEGDELYLSLTNVGMAARPDLFDAHTLHFHGFPNAAPVFDGEPHSTFGVNMGATLTYYYKIRDPGTFLYHCHVEAAEHMQMGMLGNLYVHPRQDGTPYSYQGRTYTKFAYNDGDGSTGYHVEKAIQLSSMDSVFHDLHLGIQPLPFANMRDNYPMMNGRGYPDTVTDGPLANPPPDNGGRRSQLSDAHVVAASGQRILLRLSNVSITAYYTVGALGLPMKVVGAGARQLRGPTGKDLSYDTASVTLGGGETAEVIIDTRDVAPGRYFLYTTNLNYLSNGDEDYGGMMTAIDIH